jgi:hypothetical protein
MTLSQVRGAAVSSFHTDILKQSNGAPGGPAERKGREIAALFSMIGAIPNSAWLEGCIMFDELYQNGIGSFSRRFETCADLDRLHTQSSITLRDRSVARAALARKQAPSIRVEAGCDDSHPSFQEPPGSSQQ